MNLAEWATATQLYVATVGRRTGSWRPKWWIVFAVDDDVVYLLEEIGRAADWVRNIEADPRVRMWIEGVEPLDARARVLEDPAEVARAKEAVAATEIGSTLADLIEWGLPVAIRPTEPLAPRRTF